MPAHLFCLHVDSKSCFDFQLIPQILERRFMSTEKTSSTVLTPETAQPSTSTESNSPTRRTSNRRSFLKHSMIAGAAATVGAGVLSRGVPAFAQGSSSSSSLSKGDIAILRFLAAAELIESDLWTQYAELGGIGKLQPIEVSPNEKLNPYQTALSNLDSDGPQYIASNTLDEISHAKFLNAYLMSKGADPVDLSGFANLPGSTANGSSGIGRLTNLMNLNVDTSWYVRYRSATNPDLGATFP